MQSPSRITDASASITSSVFVLQGWEDLPEGLLHSIITLLGSFRDILAFSSTCHTWRTAFSNYPSKSTFCALFPPLLVCPNVRFRGRYVPSGHDGHKLYKCQAIDPTNPKTALRCQIPEKMRFLGSSYGQLICGRGLGCLIVDVFTGARISPPYLPMTDDTDFYCGMLTVPLTSLNSHLLVCAGCDSLYGTQYCLLDWLVGSEVWSQYQLGGACISQIVDFNGKLIAMDQHQRIYTVTLAPQLGLQEINIVRCSSVRPWLVVCGDMLLMVDLMNRLFGDFVKCKVYRLRLHMLTKPAKWVEVKKLENYSLFVGGAVRSLFSCMSPQRWGGRSNCLYYTHRSLPWSLVGLGDGRNASLVGLGDGRNAEWDDSTNFERDYESQLHAFWVYPSMFYSDGR